jgi:hypothetical protein
VRGGDPYLDNAFEREAFAAERRGHGREPGVCRPRLSALGPRPSPSEDPAGRSVDASIRRSVLQSAGTACVPPRDRGTDRLMD